MSFLKSHQHKVAKVFVGVSRHNNRVLNEQKDYKHLCEPAALWSNQPVRMSSAKFSPQKDWKC